GAYLETHRYFKENEDSLINVMSAAVDTVCDAETPSDALCAFQKQVIDLFPHPQLPYGENAPISALQRIQKMSAKDIRNEAHYNVVMAAFMDVTRAHLVTSRASVNEIVHFEHIGCRMLAS